MKSKLILAGATLLIPALILVFWKGGWDRV